MLLGLLHRFALCHFIFTFHSIFKNILCFTDSQLWADYACCWRICFWQCRAAFNAGVKSTPSEAVSMINSNSLITTFSLKSSTRWSSLLGAAIWKTKTSPQRVIPPVSYLLQGDFFSSLFQKLSKLCFGTAHRINCSANHLSSTVQTMPADGLRLVERRR